MPDRRLFCLTRYAMRIGCRSLVRAIKGTITVTSKNCEQNNVIWVQSADVNLTMLNISPFLRVAVQHLENEFLLTAQRRLLQISASKLKVFLNVLIWSTASPVGLYKRCHPCPIITYKYYPRSKEAQDMDTGNKSFIMLDRKNKPSHDSSNSTIGIFTHTGYM